MIIRSPEGSGGRPDRHSDGTTIDPRTSGSFHRRSLHHVPPNWVGSGATFFITICCDHRETNQLCHPPVGNRLLDTARFYHQSGRCFIRLFLLMPDHWHALMAVPREETCSEIIRNWKSYTARQLTIAWQRNFFEHRIRNDEELQLKADYIRQNPVRKGLIADASKWPYIIEN